MLKGYTYHLTHRCHNRTFLLRFARDREAYREWLREGVKRHRVPVYGYCVTSNHVHLVVHAESTEAVSALMHLAAGSTAKQYNLRKGHLGSLWEHPYQCTIIEDGRHLLNCLCYVDLNMVRAGVVGHPREWRWCGFDELTGGRKRYGLIDEERLLESLGMTGLGEFRKMYADAIERRISKGALSREPHWTESLAVGSEAFVEDVSSSYGCRRRLNIGALSKCPMKTWTIREKALAYTAIPGTKNNA